MKKKVSVIGYGALGRTFAQAFEDKLAENLLLSGILSDRQRDREDIARDHSCAVYTCLEELLEDKPDYVIELAGAEVVAGWGEQILRQGCDFILASIGALADASLYASLKAAAESSGARIYVPSGAVGGFDLMQTISLMGETQAIIENIKAPESLAGAPYLEDKTLSDTERQVLFEGNAADAIKGFPKNVNVAVASALASVGIDQMAVQIVSVPGQKSSVHRVRLTSELADAVIEVSSRPDPQNPRSSTITAWSIVSLLQNLNSAVQFY